MRKRFIALLLVFCMCFSLFDSALAEDIELDGDAEEVIVTIEAEEEDAGAESKDLEEPEEGAETTDEDVEAPEEDADIQLLAIENGSVSVYAEDDDDDAPSYTLIVTGVPTGMEISLDSPHIKLVNNDDKEAVDVSLKSELYYRQDDDSTMQVDYLMLEESVSRDSSEETVYVLSAYSGENVLSGGRLILKNEGGQVVATAEITPIQTEMLCSLEDGAYTHTLIGATAMSSNAQTFSYPGYSGDEVSLSALTNGKTVYYGSLELVDGEKDTVNLIECDIAQIVAVTDEGTGETAYTLQPVIDGNVKNDGALYMEYDQVYSFDVEYESMVNEHTEDNGDVYLWMGTQYYVDKYHNQGTTSNNYTNTVPASNMSSAGVWVQLGNLRESLINSGPGFSTYESVTKDQLEAEGVTSEIANAVSANYNYGIAGPYNVGVDDDDKSLTEVKTYTARVTGHIGDEFVPSDVFGTEIIYMVTDKSDFHETDWIDLGAHASDTGTRAWWYWINDYYKLNNYEDELEFLEIVEREDETTGEMQVRLEADEMGESGLGEEYDIWNIDLVTKRDSVVKTDMMTNPDKYTADGVGFSNIAGLPHHVQLRMNGTFETVGDDGETYFGELTVLKDEDDEGNFGPKAPYIEYSIPAVYSDGSKAGIVTGKSYIAMENDQEATSLAFTDVNGTNVYVPQEYMFDDSQVVISVKINFTGTITSSSGVTITYTEDEPYTYEGTLTVAQLMEAYDTCPNNAGYDFAVNLSTSFQAESEYSDQLVLYKVWDDFDNAYKSRGDVDSITVTLERSKDGETWEAVTESDNMISAIFTISAPKDDDGNVIESSQWTAILSSDDLALTYTTDNSETAYYQFRIANDSENLSENEALAKGYTYNTVIVGTTVTNTLLVDETSITGKKLWLDTDGDTLMAIPVDSVNIALYQNGQYYAHTTATEENDWSFSFKNLPLRSGTEDYVYTLGELTEDGDPVPSGSNILIGNNYYHVEVVEAEDDSELDYYVENVRILTKDVDADGDKEYGDNGLSVQVGDTLTYKIDYRNVEDSTATVIITDKLDEGLTFVEASNGGTYDEATRTVTWTIENVASGDDGSVTLSATVNETALIRNEVDNTAELQFRQDSEVIYSTETVYNPVPDKDVDADGDGDYTDSGMQTVVGGTLVYKIDYENPDDVAATVTITDVLDEGLDYVSATDNGSYIEDSRTITWVIANVAAHTNGSVYFTATVNENALIKNYVDNTAIVQVGDHPEQQTKTVYNPVPEKDVDADGDKTYGDSGLGVQVGDEMTYEISYYNGYGDSATVTITDVLDEGLDFVEASEGGTYDDSTRIITWVIEDVEAHTGGNVTFTATVNESALVRNEVENGAEVSIETGNFPSTSVETNEVYNPVPDKDVDANGDGVFEDSGMQTVVGGTLVYKIDYENPDDTAATVTITDVLDIGLNFNSATDNGSYEESIRTVTWVIENVAAHTNGSVYFTATVNESAIVIGQVENSAIVQVGDHPEQQTKTVYNPVPDKDVDADDNGDYGDSGLGVQVGDTVTYIVQYFNSDEKDSATVTITDVLDEGLTFVEASDGGTYDENTRTITWIISNVEAQTGGSVTLSATVNENALVNNEIENTATVQIGDDPETAYETNTVYNPVPDKNVDANGDKVFDDSGMQTKVGGTLVYKIDYENPDDTEATVTITDVLDIGLDFVSATDDGIFDEDTRTITWVIENVAAHTKGSVYFTATVNENALVKSVVENTATVQVGDHPGQNTKTVWNPLLPEKDVDADEDGSYGDSGEDVRVGDTLTYVISYFNEADYPATVTITDTLDAGLTFDKASNGGTYDDSTRTITWVIGDVISLTGGSVTFTATVNENALAEEEVVNTAIVQIGDDPDLRYETNSVENPVPQKDVDADGNGEYGDNGLGVQVGDELEYIIYYFNSYDTPATVTITDVLDENLNYVEASDGGTYDERTRTITWVIDNVAAHSGGSVTFSAIVDEGALEPNEVENTAIVQVGDDPDLAVETNTVYNPVPDKDVDADGDGEYGDSGMIVKVGSDLTYKIDYENPDDDPATVTITDVLDIGLDFVFATDDGIYDEDTRTITWIIENVAAHTNGSVTFIATVNNNAVVASVVENTATVQVGDHPEQNTRTVWNPLEPMKDVDADGDGAYGDSGEDVHVGDDLTYIVGYFNTEDEEEEIIITDVLDEGLTFVEASDGGDYDEATRTITWDFEHVDAHTGGSVTFTAKVNDNALGEYEIDNYADVHIGNVLSYRTNTVHNPVPDKDVDADSDGVYGDSGLQVSVGDELTYRIDYFNGYTEPEDIVITDTLDIGLTFVEASDGGVYDEVTRTITWTITDVEAQDGDSVTFTAIVNESALVRNEVENTAYVQVGDDPAVGTNTVYNPVPGKDVDVHNDGSYGDSGLGVTVGSDLTYEVGYFNGYDEAAIVTVTDELDAGLTFVSADNGGVYDAGTRTITWVIADVAAHTGGSVTFIATVNDTALVRNEVENVADVILQIGDNPATSLQTNKVYNPVPHKDVDIHSDGTYGDSTLPVEVGMDLTYQIDYENPYDEAFTVIVTDVLDEGLTFVSASDGGVYDEGSRTITWIIGNVDSHTNGSVNFVAIVNESALESGVVLNTALVQVGDNPALTTETVWNPLESVPGTEPGGEPDNPSEVVSPPTGDNSAPYLAMMLMLLCAAAILAMTLKRRQHVNDRN